MIKKNLFKKTICIVVAFALVFSVLQNNTMSYAAETITSVSLGSIQAPLN